MANMMKIDHIALSVDDPKAAAKWYCENFGAELLYSDDTWAFIQFENIKMAFVVPEQHPEHFAFLVDSFDEDDKVNEHRDGSISVYKQDPWGNSFELIKYAEKK